MRFSVSFSVLLASLFWVADARPTARNNRMITIPIRSLQQDKSDIHPRIVHQQHVNQARHRFARLTGAPTPSDEELRDDLMRRVMSIESDGGLAKRYFVNDHIQGLKSKQGKAGHAHAHEDQFDVNDNADAGSHKGGRHRGGPQGGGQQGGGQQGGGQQGGSGQQGGAGSNGSGSLDEDGQPFSQKDIDASNGSITQANQPTASDSVGLDIQANDVGYIGTIQMGTPPQNFVVLFDSGSADLWVGSSTNCTTTGGGDCGQHTFLGSDVSSSFVDLNKAWSITYGTGSIQGDIIQDNVVIAGLSLNQHTFGVANIESPDLSGSPFDGILGLAKPVLSEQGVDTLPVSLAKAGQISSAVASFKLGRIADGDNDGEVTIGGTDPAKFDANTLATFDNLSKAGFFEVDDATITVDGTQVQLGRRSAILDTGTTVILVPGNDASAIHALIPGAQDDGQGGFTVPCNTSVNVAVNFGSSSFPIDPRDIGFFPVDTNNLNGDCTSAITAGNIAGATELLLGATFLKNVYASFDATNNQISLAKLA